MYYNGFKAGLPMSKKQFVSIAFFPKVVQILVLNPEKTQVDKYVSVDLPADLIVNHQIQKIEQLSQILKNVWSRFHFKEKAVGIVIPEFSTFTKSLLLPKLNLVDLDEAVKWQMQDFLPFQNSEDLVLDWKIVSMDGSKYQILAVVIHKSILSSYVDAVGLAGLYPLVVETPSLSLTRISGNDSSGKLIIYSNFGDTTLVLAQGEKIIGSSVVSSKDPSSVLNTASQIMKHYQDTQVKKIKIGGREFNRDLLTSLQRNLNLPVEWISVKLAGLTTNQLQEYLIPLSLQLNQAYEPRSELTINLLPPQWVQKYQASKFKLQVWSLTLISTFIIGCCFILTLGFYLYLLVQWQNLPKSSSEQAVIPDEISKQVISMNKLADKVIKISTVSKLPQDIINEISKLQPQGINITSYQLDLDSGKIVLTGIATDRQALVDFRQALEKNNNFDSILIPFSSFEKESNSEFEVNFNYTKLKEKKTIKIPVIK